MKIDIRHIAKLANLPLNEKNVDKLEGELETTIKHIDRLNELNTSRITPTSQVTGLENVTREDRVTASLTQEQAVKNAKRTYHGFFVVDAVLEQ